MRSRPSITLAILVGCLIAACARDARTLAGRWDATVVVNGIEIPFRFDLDATGPQMTGSFFDGEKRVSSTRSEWRDGTLVLDFEQYGSTLTATLAGDVLEGQYDRRARGLYPFRASRYSMPSRSTDAPSIAGAWRLAAPESNRVERAWRFIVRQQGPEVSAAILRFDGDTGVIVGGYKDGRFVLSHFSGARPLLLEVRPQSDGSLQLVENTRTTMTAFREEDPRAASIGEPADTSKYTRMKRPDEPFRFSFPNLDGHVMSEKDVAGKVVLISITGSWCPNCHDEAPFLVSLYRRYKDQGFEIVALSFEESEQLANPTRPRAFIRQFGIEYPFLLAGTTEQLEALIPQAENLIAFPTSFLVARDGRVRAVHAGFASVATGSLGTQLESQIDAQVQRLLAERQ